MQHATAAATIGAVFLVAAGHAETADFDAQIEGLIAQSFTDNGITFSNGTWFPDGLPVRFAADDATAAFAARPDLAPFFSPPNVMKIGNATPGPGADYVRVHGWDATRGTAALYARVDVFWLDDSTWATTELFLDALDAAGDVVASDSAVIPGTSRDMAHARLRIENVPFESIRFRAFGGVPVPGRNDVDGFLGHFDNVIISDDPLPPDPDPNPGPTCPCELNGNTRVDVFDLLAYLDLWFALDGLADWNDDRTVDVFDLLGFLDCWFPAAAGVPCDE